MIQIGISNNKNKKESLDKNIQKIKTFKINKVQKTHKLINHLPFKLKIIIYNINNNNLIKLVTIMMLIIIIKLTKIT